MRPLRPLYALFFGAALAAVLVLALFPFFPRQLPVHQGDIATADLRSPRNISFVSNVLTDQARDDAALPVPDVLLFDPTIQPQQLTKLNKATGAAGRVKADPGLTDTAKRAQLLGIADLRGLSRASIDTILSLPNDRWQSVSTEAESVLIQVMSGSIAPDAVDGEKTGFAQLISPDLSADEVNVVADLIRPLIVPTLVVDDGATAKAREAARKDVQPVRQTIAESQLIVEKGRTVDATALELLQKVGLLSPRLTAENVGAAVIVAILAASLLALYLRLFPVEAISSPRNLLLLALLVGVPVLIARVYFSLVLPDDSRRFLAYFLPLATAPMLIAALLETRLAVVIGLVQAVLMTFVIVYLPEFSLVASIEPVDVGRVLLVYGLGAVVGVVTTYRVERANQYLLSGVLVGGTVLAALFALWLVDPQRRAFDGVWMISAAAVAGLGSGLLTAGGLAATGVVFGVTTRIQLMELSQLNAPLLRRLQDEAPGTFHHSIIVANLAERAADLIGADALLVRVGCYYHDIGKVLQPGFYIENQLGGENPHDRMDPQASARIIAQHVSCGQELAKRHGLPARVQAFIPEHHGTRLIPYFYRKASQQDPKVDASLFRYPGPKPQSRETAVVMLADSTEAMARASEDRSPERIDEIVEQVVSERLGEGELDECDLTLRDVRTIADSFKRTLRAVYHPRIAYPEPTERERGALTGLFRPGRRLAQALAGNQGDAAARPREPVPPNPGGRPRPASAPPRPRRRP